MQYRQLGLSTLMISTVGFGCMSLGQDEAENASVVGLALDSGINFFDTADIYENGRNEEKIGRIVKEKRKQVLIASKVGNCPRSDGSGLDWDASRQHILQSVEGSLRRLQTDYIDLYQLHGGTMEDPIDETIGAFETLQQQGKIRYYGISSIRPAVIGEYIRRSHIVSVMMQYSLLDRRPEESCLGLLKDHDIGVLARGSLAKGLLAGKPPAAFLDYSAAEVAAAAQAIRTISGEHRRPAQTALRFVLQHPAISSAIVGLRTTGQLKDILGATGEAASGEATIGEASIGEAAIGNLAIGDPGTVFLPSIPETENRELRSAIRANYYR
jgi:aryl-alcohol dehydrogenase-like predicted oxidoreductase